jgi:hypothetical protein
MTIDEILIAKYNVAWLAGQFSMADFNDGKGIVITNWQVPDIAQPTLSQIEALITDPVVIQYAVFEENKIKNQPILNQLIDIDAQSIRALREPSPTSTAQLAVLTSQAEELRSKLLPIIATGVSDKGIT